MLVIIFQLFHKAASRIRISSSGRRGMGLPRMELEAAALRAISEKSFWLFSFSREI